MNREATQIASKIARSMIKRMELKEDDIRGLSIYAVVIEKAIEITGIQFSGSAKKFIYKNRRPLLKWLGEDVVSTQPKSRQKSSVNVQSKDFLQSYEWRKVRMMALKNYGPKCMCCGATPATGAVMNVDHIKPRKLFPALALDINNLQILCSVCNHGKGNWDTTDWRPN